MTAQELIYDGMRRAGLIRPGTGPNPEQLQDGLGEIRGMIGQWNTRRQMIFTINIASYVLTPSQPTYTIGPTGDFVAERPTVIKNANIILTNVNPVVRIPLYILDDDQWSQIRVQQIPVTIPTQMYYDGGFSQPDGNATIYLWGFPTEANSLELYTTTHLNQFVTLNTDLYFPPGYEDMFRYSLAERFCILFGKSPTPELAAQARIARVAVQSLNSQSPKLGTDAPHTGQPQPYFNYRTGDLG